MNMSCTLISFLIIVIGIWIAIFVIKRLLNYTDITPQIRINKGIQTKIIF